ncbi:hypothetical protein BJ508DRAFT_313961 [Ascobolus immersus RN42]|uniref:Uncharacterized protein n=1 Tax=Ascobolus immersus RN42 TaxID=1160509 RepID=A0A3N4HK50_ASCIM|nr:hypothetical protein BJ508DRAFT_313961 [Ascobolus immersus RN42]
MANANANTDMALWLNTTAAERALIVSIRNFPPQQNIPGQPSTPSDRPKKIGENDTARMEAVKLEFNWDLLISKQASNGRLDVRLARMGFVLLFNIYGYRPTGAPHTYNQVISMTIIEWYMLGDEIGLFKKWCRRISTLGECRSDWCSWHNVLRILTPADRNDGTLPPQGGWPHLNYPVPAPFPNNEYAPLRGYARPLPRLQYDD